MIDFNNLLIRRMIMHTIQPKQDNQDHGSAVCESELVNHDEPVIRLIRTRLIDAAGKNSKAFELELSSTEDYSFFGMVHELKNKDDEEFVRTSQQLADLLAESQTRSNIPGGFLLVLECEDAFNNTAVYIVIKAEPHEALQRRNGERQISIIEKVFLSPSQKLYKIGILYERERPETAEPNSCFGCFLFDDQFRSESHPAEYFYKDFLGFSTGNNQKIQSQRFFDKTDYFIKHYVDNIESKNELLRALRMEFTANQNDIITPANFARTYMPTGGLLDAYLADVAQELPSSIVKDDSLIKGKLSRRKIGFPNSISLVGPENEFDDLVQILHQPLSEGQIDDADEYTYLRIKGKPYSDE